MTRIPLPFFWIIAIVCIVLAAGCISPVDRATPAGNATPVVQPSPASYQVTIAQPDEGSRFLRMDTDVYNQGEVVEFYSARDDGGTLCAHDPPNYSVTYQTGSGAWAYQVGYIAPADTNATVPGAGASSRSYRFVTAGWEPNRYRIVSDCGVSREFLLRPAPTPVPTLCPPRENEPLWVRINPLGDQYIGEKFSITGTTNRAAGEELRYLVFPGGVLPGDLNGGNEKPLSLRASEGTCGENTWSVDLTVTIPREYFIMISAGSPEATAIQRFTVSPLPPP